ncbi:MAG: hypothetical protein P0Y49_20380 [Candidatus Pedobacter colombiensis]|uniref:Uncharacterized protein n=1 Tax=Candidatus Pedobacter colombiensis TaxID=3121371 RepID=A0AAJ5W8H7_9SPHI|nr:hypothetical protein [Pedobacter sp.]WEK19138.1 MAG: hypothetical protein P0Y49_20380 [Pedobacter sp.]
MKFNEPEETEETIFFILEPNEEMDIPIHVAFDDEFAAKAYLNRFRTFSDARLLECRLNPGFYTDITKDCYFMQLDRHSDVYAISLVNDLQRSELAIKGHYFFEGEQICIYLMASSENEAVKTARKIRDKVIANNEFGS